MPEEYCPVCGSDDVRVNKWYGDGDCEMNCRNCDHHWLVEDAAEPAVAVDLAPLGN